MIASPTLNYCTTKLGRGSEMADLHARALLPTSEMGHRLYRHPVRQLVLSCCLAERSLPQVARYKALQVPAAYDSQLIFWHEHRDFPVPSEVTRCVVLCISASSVQSARDFSSVGHTITNTRSRLSSEKVEQVELVRCGFRAGLI